MKLRWLATVLIGSVNVGLLMAVGYALATFPPFGEALTTIMLFVVVVLASVFLLHELRR